MLSIDFLNSIPEVNRYQTTIITFSKFSFPVSVPDLSFPGNPDAELIGRIPALLELNLDSIKITTCKSYSVVVLHNNTDV